MKSFLLTGLLMLGLTACADDVSNFQLTINNADDPQILDLLYQTSSTNSSLLEFRSDISVRFWWTYSGLATADGQEGVVFAPVQASPTATPDSSGTGYILNWQKASDIGFPASSAKLIARSVPVDRKDFQFGVEFIRSVSVPDVGVQHYVVAYGCIPGPIEQVYTRSQMQKDFLSGINIYAGRTCGTCPPAEGVFTEKHNTCFDTDTIDGGTLPRVCGAYDTDPPICTDS